jgi:hypothetical protein
MYISYMKFFYNCLTFIPGKFNTSDWLTRQYNLYNLYCEYNDNPNNTNPNDDIRKIDQNEYIIQVLSFLVNIDDQTDKILQSFPGGVAENITPGGVTNGVNPRGVTNNEIPTEVTLIVDQMFD